MSYQLGDEVLHLKILDRGTGKITTPPAWHEKRLPSVERVSWDDGSEGWYHRTELAPRKG